MCQPSIVNKYVCDVPCEGGGAKPCQREHLAALCSSVCAKMQTALLHSSGNGCVAPAAPRRRRVPVVAQPSISAWQPEAVRHISLLLPPSSSARGFSLIAYAAEVGRQAVRPCRELLHISRIATKMIDFRLRLQRLRPPLGPQMHQPHSRQPQHLLQAGTRLSCPQPWRWWRAVVTGSRQALRASPQAFAWIM